MEKRYTKWPGKNLCPVCGGHDMVRSIVEDFNRMVRIQVFCESCDTEYEDCYHLVRQEIVSRRLKKHELEVFNNGGKD